MATANPGANGYHDSELLERDLGYRQDAETAGEDLPCDPAADDPAADDPAADDPAGMPTASAAPVSVPAGHRAARRTWPSPSASLSVGKAAVPTILSRTGRWPGSDTCAAAPTRV
jgi:hypothetical protein